jgi:endoglucanase
VPYSVYAGLVADGTIPRRRHGGRLVVLLLIVLVSLAGCYPVVGTSRPARAAASDSTRSPTSTARASTCGPPSGGLVIAICGNRFVNGAGRTVVLRGVNTEGTQFSCAQSNSGFFADPTVWLGHYAVEIRALKAWGINVVRVNLNEECWLGINGVPWSTRVTGYPIPHGDHYDSTVNSYMYEIGRYVDALGAAGIYAEIDLHLNAPGGELIADQGSDDFQNPLPDAHSVAFWKSVAAYFSSDRSVVFGVFNEPFPPNAAVDGDTSVGWDCDVDGCVVPNYTRTSDYSVLPANCPPTAVQPPRGCYMGDGMLQLIEDIRDYNDTAPVVVGGPDWAGDTDQWLSTFYPGGVSIDPAGELAASVHVYFPDGQTPCSDATTIARVCGGNILRIAKVAPVLIDEVGDFNCSSRSVFPFLRSIDSADRVSGVDIGYLGWAWTTYFCDPNLISNWSTGAPSTMGGAEYCELLDLRVAPLWNPLFSWRRYCSGAVPYAVPRR